MEPLRFLTKWLLRRCSCVRRTRAQAKSRRPPLCDLVSLDSPPLMKVSQYLSFSVSGRAPRVALIVTMTLDRGLHRSMRSCKLSGAQWKQLLAWCISDTYRIDEKLPFTSAGVMDERRPLAHRFLIAEAYINSAEVYRDDLELVLSVEALMSPALHRWLGQWAWSGDVLHARFF